MRGKLQVVIDSHTSHAAPAVDFAPCQEWPVLYSLLPDPLDEPFQIIIAWYTVSGTAHRSHKYHNGE